MSATVRWRLSVVVCAIIAHGVVAQVGQQGAPTLAGVLSSSAAYLAEYETTASAVIAEERYQQSYTKSGSRQQQRILRSDVFLANDGKQGWIWLRDVLEVDGASLRREPNRLLDLMTKQPIDAQARFLQVLSQGAGYHLGNLLRTIDPPTMDLVFLRRENQTHARFSLDGAKSLDGKPYAVVVFKEALAPMGIQSFAGASAQGKFWVDPSTGCVAQTETRFDSVFYTSKVTVRYGREPAAGLWVPVRMDEEYRSSRNLPAGAALGGHDVSELLTGRAEYRNFRKLTVDASTIRR